MRDEDGAQVLEREEREHRRFVRGHACIDHVDALADGNGDAGLGPIAHGQRRGRPAHEHSHAAFRGRLGRLRHARCERGVH